MEQKFAMDQRILRIAGSLLKQINASQKCAELSRELIRKAS